MESIRKSFERNPAAWIFAVLLAFSIFSHYQSGRSYTNMCRDMLRYLEGPGPLWIVTGGVPSTEEAKLDATNLVEQTMREYERLEAARRNFLNDRKNLTQEDWRLLEEWRLERLQSKIKDDCLDRINTPDTYDDR